MEITYASVFGFIISVLLIPALIYIWKQSRGELKEVKKMLEEHLKETADNREKVADKINELEVDAQATKTNYTQKFAETREDIHINFTKLNDVIGDLKVDIGKIITKLESLNKE